MVGLQRRERVIRTQGSVWTAVAAIALAALVGYFASQAATAAGRAGYWLWATGAGVFAIRTFRAGIILRSQGIRMCAIVWSRSIPWEFIAKFSAEQQWAGHTPRSLVVELTDGRRLRSLAIFFRTEGEERAVLRDLEEARLAAIPNRR